MAIRVTLAVLLLLLSIAMVSCDPQNDGEMIHVSQALHVFTRGEERGLMHDIVVRISKYFSKGRLLLALAPAPSPQPSHINCKGLCNHRCSLHSRPKICLRACGTCCVRCKCVPPGTFGNRELCGKCYTDMTTHGNKTKCP
ncbi:gibberellin-regulated protein 14-like [Olea europaea var. sylvestris]|uniref:gibberellin-regulated protein 14-like n=1 Tax=Olea europaea var. sylvestris TaxID=158386 RepID=UPI000C1D71E0|nr:gibberellin-regulated protein 14-like [Olea europaea var. sylvestris]